MELDNYLLLGILHILTFKIVEMVEETMITTSNHHSLFKALTP